LWAGGRFPAAFLLPYCVAQVLGGIAGAALLYLIATESRGQASQSTMPPHQVRKRITTLCVLIIATFAMAPSAQQQPPRFGGAYSGLESRRQALVDNWVGRFVRTTGLKMEPGPFYDEIVSLSTKTTFDAVTHALLTTKLTDRSGASLGDALALVERLDSVRGEVAGVPGDRQFRLYVRLVSGALETLARSQQFKRAADNAVYHKGYPTNYREQSGVPSIQFSVALDGRQADIDVDYRRPTFPVGLFNGHLTASNSDVRAGNNYDKHVNRWSGFQNWWRSFFGVRQERAPEEVAAANPLAGMRTPRVGRKNIDVMVQDFLNAWLVEGDIIAAMGYVSERSYACLAQDSDNPADFDRGLAPVQLMINMKAAYVSLGPHSSLDGLVVGTRLSAPGVRVIRQPNHARFVIYSVPDDAAVRFDCESRLTLDDPSAVEREYGNYFGATFYVAGQRAYPVALLWSREDGYWKIVSWKVGAEDEKAPPPEPVPEPAVARINADPTLVQAARGFLENWLVRKNYDAAFAYLSPKSYECYNLERREGEPAARSPEEAGRKLRAALASAGKTVSASHKLESMLSAADPVHPATRVMDHPFARVFSLTSIPNALADAAECSARAAGSTIPDPMPLEYGDGFGMTVRFKTRAGDAPVLRLLWRKEDNTWRVTSYGVELP
jgi:hypothetical protein